MLRLKMHVYLQAIMEMQSKNTMRYYVIAVSVANIKFNNTSYRWGSWAVGTHVHC